MDKLATMDTIGSSFRPWLSCQGICLLNRHQTGDTDSVQPVILLPVQRDSQETFLPCEARMLWYAADRTSSQQFRDTTQKLFLSYLKPSSLPGRCSRLLRGVDQQYPDVQSGCWSVHTAHGSCVFLLAKRCRHCVPTSSQSKAATTFSPTKTGGDTGVHTPVSGRKARVVMPTAHSTTPTNSSSRLTHGWPCS